jgi:RNA recognition motif-containing protein
MRIYVGNMSFSTSEQALRSEFEKHGAVDDVTIVTDRETGRPRGFAFVNMPNASEGQAAMEALNGTEVDGRTLNVSEARPRKDAGGGGGGGFRR